MLTDQPTEHDEEQDPLDGQGEGDGIECTMGEPNTFEPEEDPDAVSGTREGSPD